MDSKHYQVVPFTGAQLPETFRQVIIEGNQALHWNEAQSRSDFQLDQAEYYLLLDHDQVLGYVGLHHVLDEATLNLVYIRSDLRGQGLGRQLLDFVLNQLAHRGIRHVFLEVRQANAAALGLYQQAGFETLIVRPRYYQDPVDDAVIMQKLLSRSEKEGEPS